MQIYTTDLTNYKIFQGKDYVLFMFILMFFSLTHIGYLHSKTYIL
jgi:hypothetical protein